MGSKAIDTIAEVRLPAVIDATPHGGASDWSLHSDGEEICPRCLTWIRPADYLRRNALGLLQHQTCPTRSDPPAR